MIARVYATMVEHEARLEAKALDQEASVIDREHRYSEARKLWHVSTVPGVPRNVVCPLCLLGQVSVPDSPCIGCGEPVMEATKL